MATAIQTVEITSALDNETNTVLSLFEIGSDAVVASVLIPTAAPNREVVYAGVFVNVPAKTYKAILFDSKGRGLSTGYVSLLLQTGVYQTTDTVPITPTPTPTAPDTGELVPITDSAFPRISARQGQTVDLNVDILRNGVLTDPFAIRYVEIYKTSVAPHNLVATIPVVSPTDSTYPAPIYQDRTTQPAGACGTEASEDGVLLPGKYHLLYSVPADFQAPNVYYDVWYYFGDDPCGALGTAGTECDIDDPQYDALLLSCCHRFWIYPDEWFCNDGLQTVRFGFEPLDQKFQSPEIRPLEVGLMPLPLYDYNFNLVNPLIPFLKPTITIETQHCELLVENAPARIGIRQGSFRSNPWVIQYDLDTSKFLKGTYRYQITLKLPNGTTRVSRKFIISIM